MAETKTRIRKDVMEINSKDAFVKFKMDAASFEKIQVSFVKFDDSQEAGSKVIASADAYIGFADAKLLAQDILSGKLAALADKEKKKGEKYPGAIWTSMGGVNEEKAKTRGLRTDGKALSRVMSISPGSKMPFILKIEQGAGESNAQGLIVPRYGTNPEVRIMVGCDADTIKKLALMLNTFIDAYITSQFTRGAYEETVAPKVV